MVFLPAEAVSPEGEESFSDKQSRADPKRPHVVQASWESMRRATEMSQKALRSRAIDECLLRIARASKKRSNLLIT